MSDYSLQIPFGIDDGELGDSSVVRAFTLGVEFGGMLARMLRLSDGREEPISSQVHTENLGRLRAVASKLGLQMTEKWINDDWVDVEVTQ